jgi:hypothetical protein
MNMTSTVFTFMIKQEVKEMPLTAKGKKIKKAMEKEYGKEKGEDVFYASQNKGKVKGTHKPRKKKRKY